MIALKVTHPFAGYAVGETITFPADMDAVQASNPAFVVRVTLGEDEAAAAKERNDARAQAEADARAQAKSNADAGKAPAKAAAPETAKPDAKAS